MGRKGVREDDLPLPPTQCKVSLSSRGSPDTRLILGEPRIIRIFSGVGIGGTKPMGISL